MEVTYYSIKFSVIQNKYHCITLIEPLFPFFLLKIIIYKSKTTTFSLQREIIITSYYFKIDTKGICGRLEMCKDTVSVNPYLPAYRKFLFHVALEPLGVTTLTNVSLKLHN